MSRPRAVIVRFPKLPYIIGEKRNYVGTVKHICCPYCKSKIVLIWEYIGSATFGWRIFTKCPHLLDERNHGIAFYKNKEDVEREKEEYLQRFGSDAVKIYRYWYFYPNTKEKCGFIGK